MGREEFPLLMILKTFGLSSVAMDIVPAKRRDEGQSYGG